MPLNEKRCPEDISGKLMQILLSDSLREALAACDDWNLAHTRYRLVDIEKRANWCRCDERAGRQKNGEA
jgi:hypothetical protein